MLNAMPRTTAPKKAAKKSTAPAKSSVVYVRVTDDDHALLAKVTDELNAAAEKAGDLRRWSQADVVRAILARRLRDRKPGELP